MKKTLSLLLALVLAVTACVTGIVIANNETPVSEDFILTMQIGNPIMTVNGMAQEIDPGRGTVPVVQNDRTLVPIRAIIEVMGGSVTWNEETETALLEYNGDIITLAIGNTTAYFNETANTLDVAPAVINDRTMLPIRFVAESYQFDVNWDEETSVITITKTSVVVTEPTTLPSPENGSKTLVVYYSATDTTEGVAKMIAAYTDATLFELEPKEQYTGADLDWTDKNSRVNYEHDNPDTRHVELVSIDVEDFDSYDIVYIGYPIWWQKAAWVVDDFIKGNDFSGKTVIPFCTSMSSPLGDSGTELAAMAGTGTWLEGKRFGTRTSETEVNEWVEDIRAKTTTSLETVQEITSLEPNVDVKQNAFTVPRNSVPGSAEGIISWLEEIKMTNES